MNGQDTSRMGDQSNGFSGGRLLRTLVTGLVVGTVIGLFTARFAITPNFGSTQVRQGPGAGVGGPAVAATDERLTSVSPAGR